MRDKFPLRIRNQFPSGGRQDHCRPAIAAFPLMIINICNTFNMHLEDVLNMKTKLIIVNDRLSTATRDRLSAALLSKRNIVNKKV